LQKRAVKAGDGSDPLDRDPTDGIACGRGRRRVDRYALVDRPANRSGPAVWVPAALVLRTRGRLRPAGGERRRRTASGGALRTLG
jgi:hypothetical protein